MSFIFGLSVFEKLVIRGRRNSFILKLINVEEKGKKIKT